MGGRLAIVVKIVRAAINNTKRTDVLCDPGGGARVQAVLFSSPGDDSPPLPGDTIALLPTQRSNGYVAVGAMDPKAPQTSVGGERRSYGRDANGVQVSEVWQKRDGTIVTTNSNSTITQAPNGTIRCENNEGFYQLAEDGTMNINGFIIDPSGLATDSAGVGSSTHTHTQATDSHGDTQQATSKPTG